MNSAGRLRLTLVMAGSGAAHLGLLAWLALEQHDLRHQAPPPPVFEVEVVPLLIPPRRSDLTSPRREAASRPLSPRRVLHPDETSPVAPLVTPQAAAPPPPSTSEPGPAADLRRALRRSPIGCANLAILDDVERGACQESFGSGVKTTQLIPAPIDPERRQGFDEKVAAREEMRIYRQTGVYPERGMREALKAAR